MNELFSVRLSQLPTVLKILITMFLFVMGTGYLVAMVNLHLTYSLADGKPGLTVDDLKRAFYGDRKNTRLAAKIDGGSMEQFLTKPGDKEKILNWIQDGATEDGFKQIQSIFTENCIRCHNPIGVSSFRPLTSYQEVLQVTKIDRGEPVALWARVAHTHIQSIGLIFFSLGMIFSFTALSDKIKIALVILPFTALVLDFTARFLAKYHENFVYIMLLTGALMGLSFAAMTLVSLYELWFKKSS